MAFGILPLSRSRIQVSDEDPPSYYPYSALPDRKPLRFPNGARLALILTINIEYWEKFRPGQ